MKIKPSASEITISLLPHPESFGDWHDKPLRYSVDGPRDECQKFQTKKAALNYRSRRLKTDDQLEAINNYRMS